MTIIGWSIWGLSCLVFLLFAKDIFDGRTLVRIATRMISVCLFIGLVTTAATDISKLHLLWFIPVTFFVCRGIAGSIISNRVRNHQFDWQAILGDEAKNSRDSGPQ